MLAGRRFKRFIVSLLIVGLIIGAIFVVMKYTDLISFHCTVTFDGNGYEIEEDKVYVKKNETVDLPELNREGYTFHGWYLGEIKWTEDKQITSNIVLIARWSPIPYEITFFVDDEKFVQKIDYDTMPVFDGTPTKESSDESKEFKFIGWEPELTVVKGNAFYTAKFQEVTKTFDVNVTMSHQNAGVISGAGEYEYNSTATLNVTANTGYIFLGWFNSDNSLHSTLSEISFTNLKKDINLIAKFDIITRYIYYRDVPSECTNNNPDSYNITDGIIKLNALEKTGYTFKGWYTQSGGGGNKIDEIDSSTLLEYTLYAYFTPTPYTIKYNLNGGALDSSAPRSYTLESDDITLVAPTRDNYVFIGWTSSEHLDLTMDITIEKGSMGDKEYTAHWSLAVYKITFDVNGTYYDQQVEYGQMPVFEGDTTLPSTSYVRITFLGWQPEITTAKEDAIYKALYSYDYNKYTVQLASNIYGAGSLVGTGSYNWGTDVNISATPNKGFNFVGWYSSGQLLSTESTYLISKISKSISIEGRFEMLYKSITYNNVPDGVTNDNPTQYDIFDGIITLNNLDIDGYTFHGWFDENNGQGNQITQINSLDFVDYILYAHISLTGYSITYDLDGGTLSQDNPSSYTIDSDTFTLNNPTKEGYSFLGWTTLENSTPNTTIAIEKGSTGDKVFKANWQANLYNITFIVDGVSEVKQFEYNTMPDYGSTPTKAPEDGGLTTYSFTGWTPQLAIVTGDATYTAQFEANIESFTLTLNANPTAGGSVQGSGTYAYNATIQISATPNSGYTFAGWYNGNTLYNSNASLTIEGLTANTTLTANFNLITATITYENTKGASNPNPTSYNINTSNIILQGISPEGYTFNGWYTGENGSGVNITTINTASLSDYTIYAYLTPITYTLSYELNGGNPVSNPTTYNIETPSFTLNNPTKTGYTFAGWKLSNSGSPILNVTISQGSTGDKEYTAYWTINIYTVTFKTSNMNVAVTDKYQYGDTADKYNPYESTPPTLTIEGASCQFLGWSLEENGQIVELSNYIITEDTTFFAVFDITTNSYYITIETNKANAISSLSYTIDSTTTELDPTTSNTIIIEHGKSITLNITISNTSAYTFVGWKKNGSLISNSNSNTYTIDITSTTTLTAQFNCISYTITYNEQALKGASNPNTKTTYTIEDSDIVLQNPELAGYNFIGWYTGGNGTGTQITQITTSSLQNYTLYAYWETITYSITFTDSKGLAPTNRTYTITDGTITLPTLSLEGYSFDGWYEDGTKYESINPASARNYNLQSRWSLISYTISYTLNGGTVSGNPDTYTIESDDITLINPTKDGYTFAGWTGTDLSEQTTTVIISKGSTGNRSYTAVFEEIAPTYAIGFQAVNSLGLDNVDYKQDFSLGVTFYYEGEQYTATYYYANNPPTNFTFLGLIVVKLDPTQHTQDAIIDVLATIEGTQVDDISDFEELDCVISTTSNSTLTITIPNYGLMVIAYFKAIEYTINYVDTDDATNNNILSFTLLENGDITLDDLEDVPTGYEFSGWYTGRNGTGTQITTISRSDLITYANDYTINIYAYLTPITYTITYNLDGGIVSGSNPTTYTIETPTFTLINPTKDGYRFVGWHSTYLYTTVTISLGSTGNKHYIAYWQQNSTYATITFEVDGMELEESITALSGSTISAPSVDGSEYGMTGYDVDGWYTDEDCTISYAFATMPSSNITLYGQWDYFIYQGFFPYLDEFQSATTSNTTYIDSYEELSAWVDYIFFYKITDLYKISPTYKTFTQTSWNTEIKNAVDYGSTYPYTTYYVAYAQSATIGYVYCSTKDLDVVCTLTADSSKSYIYTQQDYAFVRNYTQVRSNSNATFKVNNVQDTLEVSTSNQLMYALEIGVKPICVSGSSAENIYNKAQKVLNQICDDSMSDVDKVQAIYEWLILNVQYDNYAVAYCQDSWWEYDAWYAEGVFNNGVAVCDGIAKAFSILAKIENIPVVRVGGDGHAWNKVYIDGNWYGVDSTHGDLGIGSNMNVLTYNNFLFTDSFKTSLGYTSDIRSDIIANTEHNYFDEVSYTYINSSSEYNNTSFDFVINSQEELIVLLLYIKDTYDSATTSYLSFDIILGEEIDSSQLSTIMFAALKSAGYDQSYLKASLDCINSDYIGYLILLPV